jgi:hypothetical protein
MSEFDKRRFVKKATKIKVADDRKALKATNCTRIIPQAHTISRLGVARPAGFGDAEKASLRSLECRDTLDFVL